MSQNVTNETLTQNHLTPASFSTLESMRVMLLLFPWHKASFLRNDRVISAEVVDIGISFSRDFDKVVTLARISAPHLASMLLLKQQRSPEQHTC